jgi:hypothetical protein
MTTPAMPTAPQRWLTLPLIAGTLHSRGVMSWHQNGTAPLGAPSGKVTFHLSSLTGFSVVLPPGTPKDRS